MPATQVYGTSTGPIPTVSVFTFHYFLQLVFTLLFTYISEVKLPKMLIAFNQVPNVVKPSC